jgi:hypothetical protein
MKYLEVGFVGNPDMRQILGEGHYQVSAYELGIATKWAEIPQTMKDNGIYILLSDLTIWVDTEKSGRLYYRFSKNYITDLASVPSFGKFLVDDNDNFMVLASLVHDSNFGGHHLTFKESNSLFRWMMRKQGASWFQAFVAWVGVSSWKGREAYDRPIEGFKTNEDYCKMEWRDK